MPLPHNRLHLVWQQTPAVWPATQWHTAADARPPPTYHMLRTPISTPLTTCIFGCRRSFLLHLDPVFPIGDERTRSKHLIHKSELLCTNTPCWRKKKKKNIKQLQFSPFKTNRYNMWEEIIQKEAKKSDSNILRSAFSERIFEQDGIDLACVWWSCVDSMRRGRERERERERERWGRERERVGGGGGGGDQLTATSNKENQ